MMADLRTPLFARHAALGARMVPFGGWEMPVQYKGVVAEHKAVRAAAGAFDISHMGRLRFAGPGALPLLETVVTNAVGTMKEGQVRYGLVCNEAGGILDDVLVYRWADGYEMVVNASNRAKIVAWLDVQRVGRDVRFDDFTAATTMVAVQGPAAVGLCAGMFDRDVAGLKYYFGTPAAYRGKPCVVSRTGYTGEDGLEITVGNDQANELWDEVIGRGAVPCGLGARDTLRLEAAMPLYGHELGESLDPFQAGLGWAVKLDKGDFIGREALRSASQDKTKPVRVGLELEGKRAAREGCPVAAGGRPAGAVTSGSFCPGLEKSLAMGYVDPACAAVGTRVEIDVRNNLIPAVVVALPFYRKPEFKVQN
jgi:aminomethyltransferase